MKRIILLFVTGVLLQGCATNSMSSKQKTQAYNRFIEANQLEEVDRIQSFKFDQWSSLGKQHLILYRRFNEPYLITLTRPCYDLDFAQAIGVSYKGSTLMANFDYITVPTEIPVKCFIQHIHKIDKAQKKQLQQIGREQEEKET
mgnify:CR=1 FL=1